MQKLFWIYQKTLVIDFISKKTYFHQIIIIFQLFSALMNPSVFIIHHILGFLLKPNNLIFTVNFRKDLTIRIYKIIVNIISENIKL